MDLLNEIFVPYSVATIESTVFKLLLAFVLGIVISSVYYWTHLEIPERSFIDTLIILCMLISVVMVVIGDSVARAFSLVGALSIIRFRTVVQDPRDIAFVFFALAVGMAVGASDPPIAILGTFLISGIIVVLHWWHNLFPISEAFLLAFKVPSDAAYDELVRPIFQEHVAYSRLVYQATTKANSIELRYLVKFEPSHGSEPFFQKLSTLQGIRGIKLTKR